MGHTMRVLKPLTVSSVIGALAIGITVLTPMAPALAAPPSNDAFANPITISGASPVRTADTNVDATKEIGEPQHSTNGGGRSVWYSWTAPTKGTVIVATAGSSFDTLLAVYRGTSVSALTSVASNDDCCASSQSQVAFAASANTNYRIAVDGWQAASGIVQLQLRLSPSNDNFGEAVVLPTTASSVERLNDTNINATKETGEPLHGNNSARSVWYSWTAPTNSTVTLRTAGSSFDTLLAVYTGNALTSLTSVAKNDDFNGTLQSEAAFTATSGVTYRIAVDGWNGASGQVKLTLVMDFVPIPGDMFNGLVLDAGTADSFQRTATSVGATTEAGETNLYNGDHTIWFKWQPSISQFTNLAAVPPRFVLTTTGSDFNTILTVQRWDKSCNDCGPPIAPFGKFVTSSYGTGTKVYFEPPKDSFGRYLSTTYMISVGGVSGASGIVSLKGSVEPFSPIVGGGQQSGRLKCNLLEPTIRGTSGADHVMGTAGDDVIFGRDGKDTIDGGGGADVICGGGGDDELTGSGPKSAFIGQAGNDVLRMTGPKAATLDGGPGHDLLVGSWGGDSFWPGSGRDSVRGRGSARDIVHFLLDSRGVTVDLLHGVAEGQGKDALSGVEQATGTRRDDFMRGNGRMNLLRGFAGDDRIVGLHNGDTLDGGAGSDELNGGPGLDLLNGGAGMDSCRRGERLRGCE